MRWAFFLVFALLVSIAVFALASYQFGRKAATRQIPVVIFCMAGAAAVAALLVSLPAEWRDGACVVWILAASLFLLAAVYYCAKRVAQAGDILVEIGRPRGACTVSWSCLALAFLIGAVSIILAFREGWPQDFSHIKSLLMGVFWFSMGIWNFYQWSARLTIRERGIVIFGCLLNWEKIRGFEWAEDDPFVLVLRVKSKVPLFRMTYVAIPAARKNAVSEILERY